MGNTKSLGIAYTDQDLEGSTFTEVKGFAMGTSAAPLAKTATGNFQSSYGTTSATGGDTRLQYNKLTFTAAGAGETTRAFTVVTGVGTAPAGTVNGSHISLSVNGSGTVSGAGNALRATVGGTSTNPGGTLGAIQVDSDFATGGTWSNAAFLRFTNSGTGAVDYLAFTPTTGSGLMIAPHTTQVMTDSIRVKMADGNVRYIMCTTAATNRTGGA